MQDDGDVRGVEELDGIGVVLASVTRRLDWKVHSEALQDRHNMPLHRPIVPTVPSVAREVRLATREVALGVSSATELLVVIASEGTCPFLS